MKKMKQIANASQPLVADSGVVRKRTSDGRFAPSLGPVEGSIYDKMSVKHLRLLCGKGNGIRQYKKVMGSKWVNKSVAELRAEFNNLCEPHKSQLVSQMLSFERCISGDGWHFDGVVVSSALVAKFFKMFLDLTSSPVPKAGRGKRGQTLACAEYKEHPGDNMGATMSNYSVSPWPRIGTPIK